MRRIGKMAMSLVAACMLAGCTAGAEEHVGEAQGYGGTLKVSVTMDGDKLTGVKVTKHSETQGVGTRAIDALPDAMASAGTWQVDAVSGATVTSEALKAAVRMAMGEENAAASPTTDAQQAPQESASPVMPEGSRSGMGMAATGRVGPGKDDQGEQIYSFNVVFAHGVFDEGGHVLELAVDQLEVLSPNGGEGAPVFSGFPGKDVPEDAFMNEVSAWESKRQRGDEYQLGHGAWYQQMDVYEQLFTGKTVEEIEAWYNKFCSEENGRPLTADSDSAADMERYEALSEEEKQQLADVTSSATMSLRDSHGDILTAIRSAWENAR